MERPASGSRVPGRSSSASRNRSSQRNGSSAPVYSTHYGLASRDDFAVPEPLRSHTPVVFDRPLHSGDFVRSERPRFSSHLKGRSSLDSIPPLQPDNYRQTPPGLLASRLYREYSVPTHVHVEPYTTPYSSFARRERAPHPLATNYTRLYRLASDLNRDLLFLSSASSSSHRFHSSARRSSFESLYSEHYSMSNPLVRPIYSPAAGARPETASGCTIATQTSPRPLRAPESRRSPSLSGSPSQESFSSPLSAPSSASPPPNRPEESTPASPSSPSCPPEREKNSEATATCREAMVRSDSSVSSESEPPVDGQCGEGRRQSPLPLSSTDFRALRPAPSFPAEPERSSVSSSEFEDECRRDTERRASVGDAVALSPSAAAEETTFVMESSSSSISPSSVAGMQMQIQPTEEPLAVASASPSSSTLSPLSSAPHSPSPAAASRPLVAPSSESSALLFESSSVHEDTPQFASSSPPSLEASPVASSPSAEDENRREEEEEEGSDRETKQDDDSLSVESPLSITPPALPAEAPLSTPSSVASPSETVSQSPPPPPATAPPEVAVEVGSANEDLEEEDSLAFLDSDHSVPAPVDGEDDDLAVSATPESPTLIVDSPHSPNGFALDSAILKSHENSPSPQSQILSPEERLPQATEVKRDADSDSLGFLESDSEEQKEHNQKWYHEEEEEEEENGKEQYLKKEQEDARPADAAAALSPESSAESVHFVIEGEERKEEGKSSSSLWPVDEPVTEIHLESPESPTPTPGEADEESVPVSISTAVRPMSDTPDSDLDFTSSMSIESSTSTAQQPPVVHESKESQEDSKQADEEDFDFLGDSNDFLSDSQTFPGSSDASQTPTLIALSPSAEAAQVAVSQKSPESEALTDQSDFKSSERLDAFHETSPEAYARDPLSSSDSTPSTTPKLVPFAKGSLPQVAESPVPPEKPSESVEEIEDDLSALDSSETSEDQTISLIQRASLAPVSAVQNRAVVSIPSGPLPTMGSTSPALDEAKPQPSDASLLFSDSFSSSHGLDHSPSLQSSRGRMTLPPIAAPSKDPVSPAARDSSLPDLSAGQHREEGFKFQKSDSESDEFVPSNRSALGRPAFAGIGRQLPAPRGTADSLFPGVAVPAAQKADDESSVSSTEDEYEDESRLVLDSSLTFENEEDSTLDPVSLIHRGSVLPGAVPALMSAAAATKPSAAEVSESIEEDFSTLSSDGFGDSAAAAEERSPPISHPSGPEKPSPSFKDVSGIEWGGENKTLNEPSNIVLEQSNTLNKSDSLAFLDED